MGLDPLTAARIADLAYDPTSVSIGDSVLGSFKVIAMRSGSASGFEALALIDAKGGLFLGFAGTDTSAKIPLTRDLVADGKLAVLGIASTSRQQVVEVVDFNLEAEAAASGRARDQVEKGVIGQCSPTVAVGHSLGGNLVQELVIGTAGLVSGIAINSPGVGGIISGALEWLGEPMRNQDLPVVYIESESPGSADVIHNLGRRFLIV